MTVAIEEAHAIVKREARRRASDSMAYLPINFADCIELAHVSAHLREVGVAAWVQDLRDEASDAAPK